MSALTAADLTRCIAEEIEGARRFVALLEEEARVLKKGDVPALERVTADKEKLAAALTQAGEARQRCMDALGLTRDAKEVRQWLARQEGESGERLRGAWENLMELARAAQEMNLTNGKCIALLSRDTRARLEALSAPSVGRDFYRPDGQSVSPFSSVNAGFRIRDRV